MSTPLPPAPFNVKDSLFAGLAVILLKLDAAVTGVTGVAATGVLTKSGHTWLDGQQLRYVSGTGGSGLTAGDIVFVRDSNPTAGTFKLTDTNDDGTLGTALALGSDLSAASFLPVTVIEATQLDDDPTNEVKQLKRPNRAGRLFNARSVHTAQGEKYTFGMDDVLRLPEIFAGKMSGRRIGTAQIWLPDVDDAENVCALVSQEFDCTVMRDGKVTHGNSEFSKATIAIESNEQELISWTRNADITPAD
ncbi:MAG TPA: hypothetical protein VK163_06580 [Opitutaceae bacterium]|nr:hypothetical protein [Opitutaceae bacterium]